MAKNTVKLKKYLDIIEEMVAHAAITPGMLIEQLSTGKVRAQSAAGSVSIPMVALEDELQGKGIDDAYAADDPVQVWVVQRGEIVNAILTTGQTIVIGDELTATGDGTLKEATYEDEVVAIAVEAVTTTGTAARIAARFV